MNLQVQLSVIFQDVVDVLKVQEPQGNTGNVIVRAIVPLANMFGYATDLRSNTQGRGTFSMEFAKYEQVPSNVESEIVAKAGASA